MNSRVRIRLRAFFLVCLIVCAWGGALAPASSVSLPESPDPSPWPPGVSVLRAGLAGLTVEWVAPEIDVRALGDGAVEIVVPGYRQTGEPGAPRLPFLASLIALPSESSPFLRVTSVEESERTLPGPIAVAPRPEGTVRDGQGRPVGGAFASSGTPSQSGPAAPVALEDVGTVRGVRLARLTFYPARVEGDRLRVVHRLQVEVHWARSTATAQMSTPSAPDDVLLRQVRDRVLNPQQVASAPSPSLPQERGSSLWPAGSVRRRRSSAGNPRRRSLRSTHPVYIAWNTQTWRAWGSQVWIRRTCAFSRATRSWPLSGRGMRTVSSNQVRRSSSTPSLASVAGPTGTSINWSLATRLARV